MESLGISSSGQPQSCFLLSLFGFGALGEAALVDVLQYMGGTSSYRVDECGYVMGGEGAGINQLSGLDLFPECYWLFSI